MSNCENCAFKNKCEKYKECEKLKEQLVVAIKALEEYTTFCRNPAEEALAKIKELDK